MALRDMLSDKTADATTIDLEHGRRDQITGTTPSASTSFAPDEPRSKAVTPTLRRSLEVEDTEPRQHTHQVSRVWRGLEAKLPAPVARWNRKSVAWIKGPEPPIRHRINPIFERIQTLPVRLLARLPRWIRACIYAVGCVLWAVLFGVILTNYSLPTNFAGFGSPRALSCVANLWYVLPSSYHSPNTTNKTTGQVLQHVALTAGIASPLLIPRLRSTALPTASAPKCSIPKPSATHP
jgi:hypothetical protein